MADPMTSMIFHCTVMQVRKIPEREMLGVLLDVPTAHDMKNLSFEWPIRCECAVGFHVGQQFTLTLSEE